MKRILLSFFAGMLSTAVCLAQSAQSSGNATAAGQASAAAGQAGTQATGSAAAAASQATTVSGKNVQAGSSSQLQSGSTVQAELEKPLDAKKNKVGDQVIAKTTHDVKSGGHVIIPKGSKLVGHVTEVQAHSKDQANSTLGIAFDHAILKNGTEMPVALGIQAIGRGQASAAAMTDDEMPSMGGGAAGSSGARASGGGGLMGSARSTAGAVGSTAGGVVNSAGNTAGGAVNSAAAAGGAAGSSLSANSQGVVGMPGLSLSNQTTASGNAAVIKSQDSNVHLDSGTEMVLQVKQ